MANEIPAQYNSIRRIAGLSSREDGNFWMNRYEGANPKNIELSNPHDCGTDIYGRVYIVDKESHSVLRVSADGSTITTVAGTHAAGDGGDFAMPATSVTLDHPNGLHVLANGTFFILDTGNQKIRRVSSNGECTTILNYPNGFGAGRGLWVSEDERTIYFCGEYTSSSNQNVIRFSHGSAPVVIANLPAGNIGLGNLDVAPNQTVGVTSAGDHRVYRVFNPGTPPQIIAGNGMISGEPVDGTPAINAPLERVRGIAYLPDGSFFLATQKGGDIWWVDLEQNIHRVVNGAGSGNAFVNDREPRSAFNNQLAEPRAIHLATNGDLLVVSNDKGVVQAVNTTKRPQPAQLKIESVVDDIIFLQFRGAFDGRYLFESSDSLAPGSWIEESIFTTVAPTTQRVPTLRSLTKRYWRLRIPTQAGG